MKASHIKCDLSLRKMETFCKYRGIIAEFHFQCNSIIVRLVVSWHRQVWKVDSEYNII